MLGTDRQAGLTEHGQISELQKTFVIAASIKENSMNDQIGRVYALLAAYRAGRLGGEKMLEDENPALDKASKENSQFG